MIKNDFSPHSQRRGSRRKLWFVWALLMALIVGGLLFHRSLAIDGDFANANQLVYAGTLLAWVLTIVFALIANGWRMAMLTLAVSLLSVIGFFSLFRFERLDGELRPQFGWRWGARPALPLVSLDSTESSVPIPERFQSRETDSPQFLGPRRNATWPEFRLSSDWKADPPQLLWKQPIGEGWSSFAVQGEVGVTMEQRDQEEWVSAYDINDGKLLWSFVMPGRFSSSVAGDGPRSTPLIKGSRVFACSGVSSFVCLDLATGQEIWSQSLNELVGADQAVMEKDVPWGRSGSPLSYDNSVIIPLGGTGGHKHSLVAFDCNTGEELWRNGGEQVSYSSPALMHLGGSPQIVYVSGESISGFAPDSGALLWRVTFEGLSPSPNVAQPIRIDDQNILFSKGYGIGSRIVRVVPMDTDSGHPIGKQWNAEVITESQSNLRTKFTNPVIVEGHVYGLSDGILECIDLTTLSRKWKRGRYHHGQVLSLGEHLLVFAEDGRLVLLEANPEQHVELGQFPVLGSVCWNLPALSGNRLLVRNATEAACVQLGFHSATPSK